MSGLFHFSEPLQDAILFYVPQGYFAFRRRSSGTIRLDVYPAPTAKILHLGIMLIDHRGEGQG